MTRPWKVCATTAAFVALTGSAMLADASSQRVADQPAGYVGCLRGDYGSFHLTEVGGPDVPETRTWRTLYMTKVRELEVIPSGGRVDLDLQPHVGTTVRITGEREGNTLRARSVTFVGSTCK
jgi:hypothetical protein